MENIKAVIFDLDNTILDRARTFRNFTLSLVSLYFQHLAEKDNVVNRIIELDEDGYKDKKTLFTELLEELPWLTKPDVSELMTYYSIHYVKNALLMESAEEMMRYVHQKYKMGLITNGKTDIQYGKMDRLGIRNQFDFILVSEEAGVKKPDVKIFNMAIEKLNLSPEQCLYVGDHPINDIEGASKAGMKTIWFEVNQPWSDEVRTSPDFTIKHLSELTKIV